MCWVSGYILLVWVAMCRGIVFVSIAESVGVYGILLIPCAKRLVQLVSSPEEVAHVD